MIWLVIHITMVGEILNQGAHQHLIAFNAVDYNGVQQLAKALIYKHFT